MSESFLTDLRALIDVDASSGTRARYSSDAGLTRIPPLAVAFPRTPEQAVSPHLPPVERMPVPVTPFPKLFRDDPEPA